MLTALLFMGFNLTSYLLALTRAPFWGLLAYLNIYFNSPTKGLNYWAVYLPDIRWSYLSAIVLIVSLFIHKDKLSKISASTLFWVFAFVILTYITVYTGVISQKEAMRYSSTLLTYCITMVIIIKSINHEEKYRIFILGIIFFAANLSFKAYLYGVRVEDRLEGIGPADASGANLFALLLAGIAPLTIPFLLQGKLYEKIICGISLPFILNAFILCNSRGSFVALVLSVIFVFIFMADNQIRKVLFVIILCSIPAFLYIADDAFVNRLSTLIGVQSSIQDEAEIANISSGRTEIWSYGIEMAKDHPFGAGPNGFKNLARFYMPESVLTFHPSRGYGMRGAHNTYLQLIVEQGILGLLIYLMICMQSIKLIYKGFNYSKDNLFWKYNFLALGISFISIMAGGMFSARVYYEYFWWQVAIIIVAYSFVKSKKNDSDINAEITVNKATY